MNPPTETLPAQRALNVIKADFDKTETTQRRKFSSDKLDAMINSVREIDFNDLSVKHLKRELRNAEGNLRKPTSKESAVIITEYFCDSANKFGSGIARIDGKVHHFSDTHWQPIDNEEIEALLGQFAEAMGHDVCESRYYESRRRLAEQLNTIISSQTRTNTDVAVNFINGTLKISNDDESLEPHNKLDALTYVLPFTYDPEAQCPLFTNYLARVLPDGESQSVIAEFFGWIFLRNLKLEKMLVLLGHGHNGKSVLFDILTNLLGDNNISHLGFEHLRKPESRQPLLGKLLNYGSEIAGTVPPDILKKASSGEPLEFRQLYQDLVTSDNYARLAFNANTLPSLTEQTEGFYRRFLIIPFEQTIQASEKDPRLAHKIISNELPGVMNWILEGMRRIRLQEKFSPCSKSDECLKAYKLNSDNVAMFLADECYSPSKDGNIPKGDFYDIYRDYCFSNGYKACGKQNFTKRLQTQHGIQEGRSSVARFWYVAKKPSNE